MLIRAHRLMSRAGFSSPGGVRCPAPSPGAPHGCRGQVWGHGDRLGGEGRGVVVQEVRGWGGGSPAPLSPSERASRGSGSVTAPLWGCPL